MKTFKTIVALLLAAVMMLGMVACDSNSPANTTPGEQANSTTPNGDPVPTEPKDPITLHWYFRGNGVQKDTQEVEDKVNELLKTYPGLEHVTLKMHCYVSKEYNQAVILAQTSGDPIDILSTVNLSNWQQHVLDGSFMPLDDLLSDEMKAALPESIWSTAKVNGKTYFIPTYQSAGNKAIALFPAQYAAYMDQTEMQKALSSGNLREVADFLEKYVLTVREKEGTDTKWLNSFASLLVGYTSNNGFAWGPYYDTLSGDFVYYPETGKVEYRRITEWAKECYQIGAEWYAKGITHPDINTIKVSDYQAKNMMNDQSFIMTLNGGIGDEAYNDTVFTNTYGFDTVAFQIQPDFYIGKDWAAGGQGISSTCEHPEEAMLFLEMLNDTEDELGKVIYNTIVFGIEGKHYNFVAGETNRIETVEYTGSQGGGDTSYAALKWIIGNTFNAYKNQAVSDDYNDVVIAMNEDPNAVTSPLAGFTVDLSSIETELDQIKAVTDEYKGYLMSGEEGDNWTVKYDEYVKKLETAGLNKVLDELQKQVDAYLGK